MKSQHSVLILLLVAGAAGVEPAARAQNNVSAGLTVSFEDASGARVPGVHVVLTNDATSVERSASASQSGSAAIPLLPPGTYTLKAEKAGFKPVSVSQITLEVSDDLALNVRMQIGDAQDSVSVSADSLLLQSESASLSLVVNRNRIADLPLNGKNFETLTALSPGVGAIGAFNNPTVSGTRFSTNTFTIDGADGSDERTPQGVASYSGAAGFATGYAGAPSVIPVESLREFRVIAADSDATFGRGSGAQVDLVTRSGTAAFHGAGYEYLRNNAMDARDFFNRGPFLDSQGHARVPPFRYNLFGASMAGQSLSRM